jgi:preprotein translocase subunit SecE
MNSKVEAGESRLDGLKWLVVVALVGGGAFANSYYAEDLELFYRVIGLLILGLLAAFVAVQTAKGQAFWSLVREAQVEVRKVIWPTTAETNQTTLLVSIVVIIAACVMWIFDWAVGQIIKLIMGL